MNVELTAHHDLRLLLLHMDMPFQWHVPYDQFAEQLYGKETSEESLDKDALAVQGSVGMITSITSSDFPRLKFLVEIVTCAVCVGNSITSTSVYSSALSANNSVYCHSHMFNFHKECS